MKLVILILLFFWEFGKVNASLPDPYPLSPDETKGYTDLTPYIQAVNDPNGIFSISTIRAKNIVDAFKPLSDKSIVPTSRVHWLRFKLTNPNTLSRTCYISIPFTDYIECYLREENGLTLMKKSGDLLPLHERDVKVGQMVFFSIDIPALTTLTCHARLESQTAISQQARNLALTSVKLYSKQSFYQRFDVSHRIYQALFYGAILSILLYNLFIYLSLKDRSYLYYVVYILALLVFFASNSGYIFELLLPHYPTSDLYIRFLSTPVLLFFYVLFSRQYLKTSHTTPVLHVYITGLLYIFILIFLVMLGGNWSLGRSASIIAAIAAFVCILTAAINSVKKGYQPATYFLIANLLLLGGGGLYAFQRFVSVEQSPASQYSLQIASVMEVILFSFGMAARIRLTQKELTDKIFENLRLEKEKETALKNLTEEKKRELEEKVKERTARILMQKEEIITQNEYLALSNTELYEARQTIEKQNKKLSLVNVKLEKIVRERTRELKITNTQLLKANHELDTFIYRTAHDIKGPLARLMGLCQVALLDVNEQQAIEYLTKLNIEANYLNYLLNRLSVVYEINHAEVKLQDIELKTLIDSVLLRLCQIEGFNQVQINLQIQQDLICYSDQRILLFILQNLIENSIHFRKKSEQPSYVHIQAAKKNSLLLIQISDNGIGISQEETPTIFDLFSRAAGKHKKAGMGLYMTRLSIEKLKGQITLAPYSPHRTQFNIQIPV